MFLKWNIKYFVHYSLVQQIYVESMTSKLQLIMPAKKKLISYFRGMRKLVFLTILVYFNTKMNSFFSTRCNVAFDALITSYCDSHVNLELRMCDCVCVCVFNYSETIVSAI